MSETKISKNIRKMIEAEFPEIFFDRMHCGKVKVRGGYMNLAKPGWPDYVGILPGGKFLGIEIKDPDGTTSKKRAELQAEVGDKIKRMGGTYVQVTNVEDAKTKLQCLK